MPKFCRSKSSLNSPANRLRDLVTDHLQGCRQRVPGAKGPGHQVNRFGKQVLELRHALVRRAPHVKDWNAAEDRCGNQPAHQKGASQLPSKNPIIARNTMARTIVPSVTSRPERRSSRCSGASRFSKLSSSAATGPTALSRCSAFSTVLKTAAGSLVVLSRFPELTGFLVLGAEDDKPVRAEDNGNCQNKYCDCGTHRSCSRPPF